MLESRVLRRIFEPKKEEVAGDWRRLHNEELHNMFASPIALGRANHGGRDAGIMDHIKER
jgi:hypothetical protein